MTWAWSGTTNAPSVRTQRGTIHVMADWLFGTGLYLLGVALIPVAGLLLTCWGLWGDRSKGRSRCPKCWYDMRGSLPKLQCPECGYDAKQKRGLYRNRPRWWPIALGLLSVLLLSHPLTVIGGWYREQSAIQKLTRAVHMLGAPIHIGPEWPVGRLPERAAKFFDRIETVQIVPGGTHAGLVLCKELRRLRSIWILECAGVTDVADRGVLSAFGAATGYHALQWTGTAPVRRPSGNLGRRDVPSENR